MGKIKDLASVRTPAEKKREQWTQERRRIKRGEQVEMTEEAKEARRAYYREWNRKNRDKVKATQARYWERKAKATAQGQKIDEQE